MVLDKYLEGSVTNDLGVIAGSDTTYKISDGFGKILVGMIGLTTGVIRLYLCNFLILKFNWLKPKHPYLLGLLCIIPLIGAFVGIGLLLYGIFKYKDKWLIIIGASGILSTVSVYSLMFYNLKYSKHSSVAYSQIAQQQLNALVNEIEFFKIQREHYPDSLEQLREINQFVIIADPLIVRKLDNSVKVTFEYENLGENYFLYSAGPDGIAHTADDIFPLILANSKLKYGFKKTW